MARLGEDRAAAAGAHARRHGVLGTADSMRGEKAESSDLLGINGFGIVSLWWTRFNRKGFNTQGNPEEARSRMLKRISCLLACYGLAQCCSHVRIPDHSVTWYKGDKWQGQWPHSNELMNLEFSFRSVKN